MAVTNPGMVCSCASISGMIPKLMMVAVVTGPMLTALSEDTIWENSSALKSAAKFSNVEELENVMRS